MKQSMVFLNVGLMVAVAMLAAPSPANGQWSPAISETALNSDFGEGCPIETPDGLSILIASNREDGGLNDIWVADRASIGSPWNAPEKLEAASSDAADFCPFPIRRYLFFVSTRGGTCGGGDIYLIRQSPTGEWTDPARLDCAPNGPNTPGPEYSPSLVETPDGTYLFYSSNGPGGDQDIFMSTLGENGFGPGTVVERLSTGFEDLMPNVRARDQGGFEVVFNSNRPTWGAGSRLAAHGGQDVYSAWITSPLPQGNWSSPQNLGASVNTGGNETRATLSGDGTRLHFGRDGDIFVSER